MTTPSAPVVDVHAHHLPDAILAALRLRSTAPRLVDGSMPLVDCGSGLMYPLLPGLIDLEGHLARMDAQGITTRLLSVPPPGVAGLSRADSIAVARDANDELATLPGSSHGRLRGLAVLPLQHPDAAAEELHRAADLGLAGAQMLSNAEGRPLDGPDYHPLFAAAAERDVTLVIHPTLPIDRAAVDAPGLTTTLGFLFDTTACVARLIVSGIYDRHPELKLLLPHVGSTLPLLMGRFDYEFDLMGINLPFPGTPSEHLRRLYVDCVCESPGALRLAVETFGADHIMFGSDEPFWSGERAGLTLAAARLGSAEVEQIQHGTATTLFGPAITHNIDT